MVKEPVAGRVKTRLSRDIGVAAATTFYRHNMTNVVGRLSSDARWQTILSVAPAQALASCALPASPTRQPQYEGDLGARMQAIFGQSGAGPVVVIGTDIPQVAPQHIAAAFRALGNHDVVFGPAVDGGFWLVGMRRAPRVLNAFCDVRWSMPETLRDCLSGLSDQRVSIADMLSDVDDASDLERLRHSIGRRILPIVAARREKQN